MNVPIWASELARLFWAKVGYIEPFPRNLRRPIARAVPLSIVLLPQLSIKVALHWLQKCGMVCDIPGADRRLRACLVVQPAMASHLWMERMRKPNSAFRWRMNWLISFETTGSCDAK